MGGGASKKKAETAYAPMPEDNKVALDPQIAKKLASTDKAEKIQAIETLGACGEGGAQYASDLAALLPDPDRAGVRRQAALALGKMGVQGAKGLASQLGHEDKFVREAAAWGLGKMGPGAATECKAIAARLCDPEPLVRRMAAEALGLIGPASTFPRRPSVCAGGNNEVIGALAEQITDDDELTRNAAAVSLSKMGIEAAQKLIERLDEPTDLARQMAAYGLTLMGDEKVAHVAKLVAHLNDPNPIVRKYVLDCLAGCGQPACQPYMEEIADHLHDMDKAVRKATVRALDELKSEMFVGAEDAANLADPDPAIRRAGAFALSEMGKGAAYHLEALAAHLEDPDKDVKDGVNMALKKLGAWGLVWEGTPRAFNFYNNIDGTKFAGSKDWQKFVTVTEQDLLMQAAASRGQEGLEMAIRLDKESGAFWQVVTVGGGGDGKKFVSRQGDAQAADAPVEGVAPPS